MVLPDVNVLVYAHREDTSNHPAYRQWLSDLINSNQPFGLSDLVLSAFLRVVTHPRIFILPSTIDQAFGFANQLRGQPNCVILSPGPGHWEIFEKICRQNDIRGNLISDAYHAALAIETGSEWITTDRDFSRFPGLKWRHPLKS